MATAEAGGDLRLSGVTKRFSAFTAVDGIDLTIAQGEFFAMLGPSGCGKTTTLRMVAGLEEPTEGSIHLGDLDVTHKKPYQRPVNTVFQNYALFPHLTIFENVAFGLRRRGVKDVKKQATDALDLVELGHLAQRKPAQLSGGQQQRIALARAVVNRPQVLLLDEPLGALDLKLRRQMQIELKRIQTEVGITFVHVTHDQEEAMTMADRVAVMNHGKIEQLGAPSDLYESPDTTFVANFLGQSNLVPGTRTGTDGGYVVIESHGQKARILQSRCVPGSDLLLGVRPEKIRIQEAGDEVPTGLNRLTGGVVVDASYLGVSTQYLVRLPWGQNLTVFSQNLGITERFRDGSAVTLAWEPDHSFGLAGDAAAGVDEEAAALAAAASAPQG
ncbi:ABC transporter ATP-binding protein [Kineosporia mesophila]|uniref:Spermidine/putrescine import ATP-binding protein PotA n=1 Tax=Kineosporia mesophila TaxID=566012 RepID=A0ABP6Z2Z8_9ACTN|nr:ABC transporter ATP-binding protein [Kineosporia mesophila]MCD5353872.1 ABC transporter ATP-binding protein [Kineosporia mesophila]